ncbi:HPF/RaiA family ribosome-associated protein [soil metagenome]
MQIQINSDHNIHGHEAMAQRMTADIADTLGRVSEHVTRVEVHLSIESDGKSGPADKRCLMEARIEGLQPMAVTEEAVSLDKAVHAAAGKMLRIIDATLERRRDRKHDKPTFPPASVESPDA